MLKCTLRLLLLPCQNPYNLNGHLQRVVPDCGAAFAPIWDALNQSFWPAVFDGAISLTLKNSYSHSLFEWVVWEYEIQLKQLMVLIKHQEQG